MARHEFFQYIGRQQIGLCLHLSRAFETFALLPYEMAQLGVRTTMSDNGSALTQAIAFNALQNYSVGLDYTVDDVATVLDKPLLAWDTGDIKPPMRIRPYVARLLASTKGHGHGKA